MIELPITSFQSKFDADSWKTKPLRAIFSCRRIYASVAPGAFWSSSLADAYMRRVRERVKYLRKMMTVVVEIINYLPMYSPRNAGTDT